MQNLISGRLMPIVFIFIMIFAVNAHRVSGAEQKSQTSFSEDDLFEEKLLKFSDNKKTFLMTNSNQQLRVGDFFTIVLDGKRGVRALAAREADGRLGAKFIKIYSLTVWTKLERDLEVKIIRGDDSYYSEQKANPEKEQITAEKAEIEEIAETIEEAETIEDLYAGLEKEFDGVSENKNRRIAPDNMLTASLSFESYEDAVGASSNFTFWWVSYARQLGDNFFFELLYGQSSLSNYPFDGLETTISNVRGRIKYVIGLPLYFFALPYIGYESQTAEAPDAGVASQTDDTSSTAVQERLQREVSLVDDFKTNGVIFGVTVLKRMVPGWFFKADIGTDGYNVGLALEF